MINKKITRLITGGFIGCMSTIVMALGPDTIYSNGTIITISESNAQVEAVAVKDGKITATGSKNEIMALADVDTNKIDLKGKTMLPGFIDAHGHFYYTAEYEYGWSDLNSIPSGQVGTVDDLIAILKEKSKNTPEGEWILGWGYDHTSIKGGQHPTAADLDKVSTKHPIYIQHVTGWFSSSNSLAMEMAGIDKNTPNPQGVIGVNKETGEPTGVIYSAQSPVYDVVPKKTKEESRKAMIAGAELYLSAGVTTAQEAWGYYSQWEVLKDVLKSGSLKIRVNFMPLAQGEEGKNLDKYPDMPKGTAIDDDNMLVIGARKMTADGTIKGSAHVTEAYAHPPAPESKGYKGKASHKVDDFRSMVLKAHKQGLQLGIHGNGDAAVDNILDAIELAQKKYPQKDVRHFVIHNQLGRDDQMIRMKELNITPSFFSSYIYYGGDHAYELYGEKRAKRLNPAGSAKKLGLKFTLHSDTYVTPMLPLRIIQSAVDRKTYSGRDLGKKEQGIDVYDAIKAVTINAAWQNHEEKIKGSIEVGKLADFVILEKNPLKVDHDKISDIVIKATIVNDKISWGGME